MRTENDHVRLIAEAMDGVGMSGPGPEGLSPSQSLPSTVTGQPQQLEQQQITQLQTCGAVGCQHNMNGSGCQLAAICINEQGGCEMYEAKSDGADGADGRYNEIEDGNDAGQSEAAVIALMGQMLPPTL